MKHRTTLNIILIFILFLTGLNTVYANRNYSLSNEPRPLTTEEKNIVIEATKKFFGDEYKDQFDSLQFLWPDYNGNKSGSYCGLVNIKNSKGQYQGYNAFILYFQKNDQDKLTINYIGTPKEEDIKMEINDIFLHSCKRHDALQYDLMPLLSKQGQ